MRPGCRERSAPGLLTVAVVLLGFWGSLHAFQGMASPNRPSKPVARVETTLSPITVAFADVAEQAGLNAVNVSGSEDRKRYILETTGTGVALFDYDSDGRVDIFIPNGTTIDGAADGPDAPTGHLYRNLGGLRFEDVTTKAGLAERAGAKACASATTTATGTAICS